MTPQPQPHAAAEAVAEAVAEAEAVAAAVAEAVAATAVDETGRSSRQVRLNGMGALGTPTCALWG